MKQKIKVRDAVSEGDYLKVWTWGRTSVTVNMKSDAFDVKNDPSRDGIGRDVVKANVVLNKDQVAKLHKYLGKVLDQMEDVE